MAATTLGQSGPTPFGRFEDVRFGALYYHQDDLDQYQSGPPYDFSQAVHGLGLAPLTLLVVESSDRLNGYSVRGDTVKAVNVPHEAVAMLADPDNLESFLHRMFWRQLDKHQELVFIIAGCPKYFRLWIPIAKQIDRSQTLHIAAAARMRQMVPDRLIFWPRTEKSPKLYTILGRQAVPLSDEVTP